VNYSQFGWSVVQTLVEALKFISQNLRGGSAQPSRTDFWPPGCLAPGRSMLFNVAENIDEVDTSVC
jgi:hypothetical protein